MTEPEPLESFENLILSDNQGYVPNRYCTNLKQGVDLTQLRSGEGCSFEIDPDQQFPHGDMDEESNNSYFDDEEMFHQLNHEVLGVDDEDDPDNSKTPFESMAKDMEDLTGDGGVLKKIVRPGVGPVVARTASVRFHYNGYREYCDEPYDSSRFRGKPENMKLGGGAFPGIDIAVASMRKGEFSKFLFDKEYVFKDMGCEPRVPAATVMWEVELVSFVDHGPGGLNADINDIPQGDNRKASFEHLLAVANGHKEVGNDLYKRKQIQQAISRYMKAIKMLEECRLQNEDEEGKMNQLLLKLYSNMSQCALELGQAARAIKYARKVLYIDPRNVKAIFKMGKAFMKESEFDRAREYYVRALRRQPNSKEIKDGIVELNKRVEKFKIIEKENAQRAMRGYRTSDSDQDQKEKQSKATDDITEETKKVMYNKLRDFKEDQSISKFVVPSTLSEKEMALVQEIASEMGIKSEINRAKGNKKQLMVWK